MIDLANTAIDWTLANWEVVAVAALVALQAVNKVTARWDEGEKHWATRMLLLLTELLSVLTSRGWNTAAGPLKLPLTPRSGKRGSIFPPSAAMVLLIGGVLLPASNGCASSANWRKDADKTIRVAHEMAKAGWVTARKILHAQCMDAGRTCATTTSESQVIKCAAVQECRARRYNAQTAYMGVQQMCTTAAEALHEYDRLAAIYVDTSADETSNREAEQRLLEKTQAEVQERVDRAERAAVNLMRKLELEGLTDDGGAVSVDGNS